MNTNMPIVDALLNIKDKTACSFHALPIFKSGSIKNSALYEKYVNFFGKELFDVELTTSGNLFDDFFFPDNFIKNSEGMASELFGADGILFVTTGTTTSNKIAASALFTGNGPVLIDKNCHQSIHFAFQDLHALVDYLPPELYCSQSERSAWSVDTLLKKISDQAAQGLYHDLIVLTAQSYEGLVYDIPEVIQYLLDAGCKTRKFLIDEAWGASNYFNRELWHASSMKIDDLIGAFPDLEVVCTQSIHKSMSALRQASMIHYRGGEKLKRRLIDEKFRIHSTSPSYPILASLDFARAQMALEGVALVDQCLRLTKYFKSELNNSNELSLFKIIELDEKLKAGNKFLFSDATKLSINIEALGISSKEVRQQLFENGGIYINRFTEKSILLNFHIGISEMAVSQILEALKLLQKKIVESDKKNIEATTNKFIIPYPPGVPLLVPGEKITASLIRKIENIRQLGAIVLEI